MSPGRENSSFAPQEARTPETAPEVFNRLLRRVFRATGARLVTSVDGTTRIAFGHQERDVVFLSPDERALVLAMVEEWEAELEAMGGTAGFAAIRQEQDHG